MLLIAVPVTLILTLVGLSRGFLENSAKRQEGIGAEILFRPPGSSLMTFSAAGLPEKFIGVLEKEPHIAAAAGVTMQLVGGGFDSIAGIDQVSFTRLSGPFEFLEGHKLEGPDDILLDQYYADQRKVKAGEKINILNRDWNVAGVVEGGKLAHMFVDIGVLQKLIGATGKFSAIYLKLDDPKNTRLVMDQLNAKYEGYLTYSIKDIGSQYSVDNIPILKGFINAVQGIGIVIGFAVVSLSMYMAVLQRTREIGILKSLGASQGFVMGMILAEALILGFGGTIGGVCMSFGTRALMHKLMAASLPQAIVPGYWPVAGAIAMGGAFLGALLPGMMAVRQDPIEALAYE